MKTKTKINGLRCVLLTLSLLSLAHALEAQVNVTKKGITPPRNLWNYDHTQSTSKFGQMLGVKRYSSTLGDTLVGYLPVYYLGDSTLKVGSYTVLHSGNVSTLESDPTVAAYTKTLTSASVLLTQIKTVDGAGSGLDGDLLDGQHGTYFLDLAQHTGRIPAFSNLPQLGSVGLLGQANPGASDLALISIGTGLSLSGGILSGAYTASNGLTLTSTTFKLGGTLTASTTIAQSTYPLSMTGTGSEFTITPGTSPSFYQYVENGTRNNYRYQNASSSATIIYDKVVPRSGAQAEFWISSTAGRTPYIDLNTFSGSVYRGIYIDSNYVYISTNSSSRYPFPTTQPSITNGVVTVWTQTGNGSTTTPAWTNITSLGLGTVTSVGLSMPTGFSVSGSPVTSSGTLAVTTTLTGVVQGNGSGLTASLGTANQLLRTNAGATAAEWFTPTYLTANQTITLSGDVTGSGSTAITTTIANDAVTYAKMQNVSATSRFLGRITTGAGDVEELTGTQATTLLSNFVGDSGSGGTKGLVPAPASGDAAALKFLKADGTWAVPPGGVSGSGTADYAARWTSSSVLAAAALRDNGTNSSIGLAPFSYMRLALGGTVASSAGQAYAFNSDVTFDASTTTGNSFYVRSKTTAGGATLSAMRTFNAGPPSYGAGTAITSAYGFDIENQGNALVTNAYGLYVRAQTGATNNWGIVSASAYNWYTGNSAFGNNIAASEVVQVVGNILLSGVIKNADGSASAPAYSFTNDLDCGLFRPTTNTIALAVGGTEYMRLSSAGLALGTAGSVQGNLLLNGSTSGTITVKGAAAAGTWTMTLPTSAGTSGYVLQTDGAGVTSWVPASGGISGSGTSGRVTYWNGTSSVTSDAAFTYASGALTLGVAGTTLGALKLTGNTSGTVTINTAAAAGTWTMVLPTGAGSAGQVLSTTGSATQWSTLEDYVSQGGDSYGTTMTIGTNDANRLVFEANNVALSAMETDGRISHNMKVSTQTVNALTLFHDKTVAAADDDELRMLFNLKDNGGNTETFARIGGIAANVANGSEAGTIAFSVMKAGTLTINMNVKDTEVNTLVPFKTAQYTATAASALTAQNGWIIYVTSTNATFTSVGHWARENGTWVKL